MSDSPPRIGAVIVAAGSGVRFGQAGKVFADLDGRPVLAWSLECFARHPRIGPVVVVLGAHTLDMGNRMILDFGLLQTRTCLGGATRSDSVRAGLAHLSDMEYVLVHDGARPLISDALIDTVIDATVESGAAVPVLPLSDTVHVIGADGRSAGVVDRTPLRAAQTPQGARVALLNDAFDTASSASDEGSLLLAAGVSVVLVDGDPTNIKITWPGDLEIAQALIAARKRQC
jgi:2-C-methyl-D-erythritol 4-phosphate cytidylyltransferase